MRGRVVEVAPPGFVIMSQEGRQCLDAQNVTLPGCGDIVEALVDDGVEPPQVVLMHRLVVPVENPLTHPDSLFDRLHRDEGRIRQLLLLKSRAFSIVRSFFYSRDFVEWPTPSLVASPGLEVYLQGFVTHYLDAQGRSRRCYLPTSPEFSLKKALCAGMERIYEICHCFRNGGEMGPLHQCEFTMLEWYRAYVDYRKIMDDVEELGAYLKQELGLANSTCFRGREIDWSPPWPRTSLREAFIHRCGIDLELGVRDQEYLRGEARRLLGESGSGATDFDSLFVQLFLAFVEPHLGLKKPEILYDYPIGMAALAARKPDEPSFAERFEVYVAGMELANAFTELNDPVEQEARFEQALQEKRRRGYPEVPIDREFLRELTHGMPPAAGIALGVERLLMALTGTEHIEDLFFLPHQWDAEDGQRLWPLGEGEA
ncbi:MAG: EF-P lysine aminoacylase GenX [Deltaproteobacteria bacterium]|nr:MAG: EF-P lysine aminoacylase GenX [Deltaproteobacteria bacterium]